MAEELRWAIIGTGFISNTVAEAIAASPGSQVELVSGRDAGRVAEFAERHRIARTCVGFAEAVTDSGRGRRLGDRVSARSTITL